MQMSAKQSALVLSLMASTTLFAVAAIANPVQDQETIVRHGADVHVYLRDRSYRPFSNGFYCNGDGPGCGGSGQTGLVLENGYPQIYLPRHR